MALDLDNKQSLEIWDMRTLMTWMFFSIRKFCEDHKTTLGKRKLDVFDHQQTTKYQPNVIAWFAHLESVYNFSFFHFFIFRIIDSLYIYIQVLGGSIFHNCIVPAICRLFPKLRDSRSYNGVIANVDNQREIAKNILNPSKSLSVSVEVGNIFYQIVSGGRENHWMLVTEKKESKVNGEIKLGLAYIHPTGLPITNKSITRKTTTYSVSSIPIMFNSFKSWSKMMRVCESDTLSIERYHRVLKACEDSTGEELKILVSELTRKKHSEFSFDVIE